MTTAELRDRLLRSLHHRGFRIGNDGLLNLPRSTDKDRVRRIHRDAVQHRIDAASRGLRRYEARLLRYGLYLHSEVSQPKSRETDLAAQETIPREGREAAQIRIVADSIVVVALWNGDSQLSGDCYRKPLSLCGLYVLHLLCQHHSRRILFVTG